MVLDTSAIIAILFEEEEAERFARAIEAAAVRLLSVANWVETGLVVLARKGEQGFNDLERFISDAAIDRVQIDPANGALAIAAFRRFGKGRHAARLNFGDCFAYALAKATGEPLLFKGGDFALTDIAAAA
jgi:ribonuclease VapC